MMADGRRVMVVVGAVAGAVVTCCCAILFAWFATPVLLRSSGTALYSMAVFMVVLSASLRWKKARKRRLVAVR
jgi:hypothetical protein